MVSVTDPAEHAAYVRRRDPNATLSGTAGVVLVYQQPLLDHALASYPTRPLHHWVRGDLRTLNVNGHPVALCGGFGVGAPAAALVLEQLIALGARRVITIGTAATLTPELAPGSLVVCSSALRDDGVSRHYLPPGAWAAPAQDLTRHLTQVCEARGIVVRQGPTWTTDAPYRETAGEVGQYALAGVLTADMESAGLFAVAAHRRIPAAAVLAVADSLVDRQPRQDHPQVGQGLRTALDAALTALTTFGADARPCQPGALR
nr:nucleoside phosphorylase [Streptomyces sp. CBMA152]